MKQDVLEMLLRRLMITDLYRNDGRGRLYRYDTKKGIWVALDCLTGKYHISMDLRKDNQGLYRRDLEELFCELRENIRFSEPKLAEEKATPLVVVVNGVLNIETGELMNHSPQLFFRHALDFTYKKELTTLPGSNAWFKLVQTSLGIKDINADDSGRGRRFMEAVAYSMSKLPNCKKMTILIGPANCGKSVVLKFLERIVGDSAWVPLSFADMCHRFRGSLMENMQLITSDEIQNKPIRNIDTIKKVVGGDPLILEGKGVDGKKSRSVAKIVFATNNMPVLGEPDIGGGFAERLLLIPFVKRGNATDPGLLEKLWADRDDFMSVAMKTLPGFIARGQKFTLDAVGEHILQEFRESSFSLGTFVRERCIKDAESRLPLAEFYKKYCSFCTESMIKAIVWVELKPTLVQLGLECRRMRVKGYPNAVQCVLGLAYRLDDYDDDSDEAVVAKTNTVVESKEG